MCIRYAAMPFPRVIVIHITFCIFNTFYSLRSYLKSAALPMWAVYQFLVSVVLLRILIVMMTITYRRIYDDLDKQWK